MTPPKQKRILVISHVPILQMTRVAILKNEGYDAEAVETPEQALARLAAERFDLVVVGGEAGEDRRLAALKERHPSLPILKIASSADADTEQYKIHYVQPQPNLLIGVVRELLGE
jgi:CheY-like chemotaxis protein